MGDVQFYPTFMRVPRVSLTPCGLQDKQQIAATTKYNRFFRTNYKYRENVIDKQSGNVRRKNFFLFTQYNRI